MLSQLKSLFHPSDVGDATKDIAGFPSSMAPLGVDRTEAYLTVETGLRQLGDSHYKYTVDVVKSNMVHWPQTIKAKGNLTHAQRINVPNKMKEKLLIPAKATHFRYLYPVKEMSELSGTEMIDIASKGPGYSLLLLGGFVYEDAYGRVVGSNAIQVVEGSTNVLVFSPPVHWTTKDLQCRLLWMLTWQRMTRWRWRG